MEDKKHHMAHVDDLSLLANEPFSKAVTQFRDLVNGCDGLSFLIGAGRSRCAGLPLTKELTDKVLADSEIDSASKDILLAVKGIFADANDAHIEDCLSEIVGLLAITDRRAERGVQDNTTAVGSALYSAEQLRTASNQVKRAIARAIDGKVGITTHQDFVTSVHQPIRVGRPAAAQPVDYMVLNYDTILEDALALRNIIYADGLNGGATGWWDPTTFDSRGLSARVIKVHGSID